MKRRRVIAWGLFVVIFVGCIGIVAAARRAKLPSADGEIPVSEVKRGDLDLQVVATGELRATNTGTLIAPPVGGGGPELRYRELARALRRANQGTNPLTSPWNLTESPRSKCQGNPQVEFPSRGQRKLTTPERSNFHRQSDRKSVILVL
jgi:hypothetical protein